MSVTSQNNIDINSVVSKDVESSKKKNSSSAAEHSFIEA
jgi:hypothetical protein